MQTYKEIKERVFSKHGSVMLSAELTHLRKFAFQVSHAYQPSIEDLLHKIDQELGKFAFTLGDIVFDGDDLEKEGCAYITIHEFATKHTIENVAICLRWEKLASGQQYKWRSDGSALNFSVDFSIFDTDKDHIEKIFNMFADEEVFSLDDEVDNEIVI